MATLTLRILTNSGDTTKGSTLSSTEMDQNLISLNNELKTATTNVSALQSNRLLKNSDDVLSAKMTVNGTGSIVYDDGGNGGFIPHPGGGTLTTTAPVTGAIKITLPVLEIADMMSFWVDIYDYTTDESVSIFISGYKYTTTQWINPTAIVYTKRDDKNFAVRFGGDATNAIVWIGEVDTVWEYPQVLIRDFQVGYNSSIHDYVTGWSVTTTTSFDTVSLTQSNNFPAAKTNSSFSWSSSYVPTSYAYSSQHLNTVTAPFYSTCSLTGSAYYPMAKTQVTGATKTVNLSIGALHNADNTIDFTLHRINGDGTSGATIMRWLDNGAHLAHGSVLPSVTNTYDLGTTSLRWRNIYTQDLHLSNGIGDYTVIEGVENLYLVNNKTNKSFKFALIEVDPAEVPEKSKVA